MGDLTTLASVKLYLGKTNNDSDDVLTLLISQISKAVENYTGRNFLTASYDVTLDGNGASALYLPERPVTAITTLEANGKVIQASASFYTDGYVREPDMVYLRNMLFPVGRKNVRIAYTAGYANVASLPADIVGAVNETVALRFKERDWLGFKSKSLAGETITFETAQFSKTALNVLDSYMVVAL